MSISNDLLFHILGITNKPQDTDIILEKCGDINSKLTGYYIVLPKDKIRDMQLYLKNVFMEHEELIQSSFELDDEDEKEKQIIQCCSVYCPDRYTQKFIEKYDGIDNLIKSGPAGEIPSELLPNTKVLNSSDFEEECEEDPEVILELQEQLKKVTEEKQNLENKLKYFHDMLPEDDLTDDILEQFMGMLNDDQGGLTKESLRRIILEACESEDEKKASLMVGLFFEQYVQLGSVN